MKKHLAIAAAGTAFLVASAVLPCGAPFGTGIDADPQQDIIVVHKNGIETYVFQPRFCGTASNFGLILPIPSTLTQAPAQSDQQAFTTANTLSAPLIVDEDRCSGPPSRGAGGSAGGTMVDAGATVISTGRVGFLDFVQLKADTEQSFTDWLNANGYPYSTASASVFSYYVQKSWYFVAFKISQGAKLDGGSGTTCNALGPVKLSFASATPVVPTRMASASAAPTFTSYSNGFSWRIFGITAGDQQLAFTDGASANRTFGFSGALAASDVSSLAGLAQSGDRLSKFTLTFSYGSTEPDVGLSLAAASDYRETQTVYHYVSCPDGGKLDAPIAIFDARKDAGPQMALDSSTARDGAVDMFEPGMAGDANSQPVVDTLQPIADAFQPVAEVFRPVADAFQPVADARTGPDSAFPIPADAGITQDASPPLAHNDAGPKGDAATPEARAHSGGCSVLGTSTEGKWLALALLGFVLGARVRRRRMR